MRLLAEHAFGSPASGGPRTRITARKWILDNGLQAILVADRAAPIVAYQTWFRVGSRHEHAGKTGLAHFFEHLMFNETEGLQQGEFDRRLESVGSDTNAATWLDWTYYRENVPRQHLELVMEMEAERMSRLVVRDKQVESERTVVASERRAHVDDDVEGFLAEQLYATAYVRHPYRWPTIGWMSDIMAFSVDDACSFYRTYYAPNNATVVMVGDLDEADALARLEHHYGGLAPQRIPDALAVDEPEQSEERRERFAKEVMADRLLMGWHAPGLASADHAPLAVAADLLAGGPSSRLYRRLVIDEELCNMVGMEVPEFRDGGLVELRAWLMRGHGAAEAEAIIDEELASLADTAPPLAEVAKSKHRLETGHWRGLRHPEGKARNLGHYETTVGDFRRLFDVATAVAAVTPADVQRVVAHYLPTRKRTVIIGTPRGDRTGGGAR